MIDDELSVHSTKSKTALLIQVKAILPEKAVVDSRAISPAAVLFDVREAFNPASIFENLICLLDLGCSSRGCLFCGKYSSDDNFYFWMSFP